MLLAGAALVIAVNLVAHFLPPERASVAPDDYGGVATVRRLGVPAVVHVALADRERPLSRLFVVAQALVVGVDADRGRWLILAASTLQALAALAFLSAFLDSHRLALAATVLYVVLPMTIEIHHTPIYANIDVAIALYASSAAAFLHHLRRPRWWLAATSAVLYAAAVLWYEIGFLLPVLLLAVTRARFPERWRACLPLFAIAAMAAAYRLSAHTSDPYAHAVGINARPLLTLVHHYLGLFLLRTVSYGLFCFGRLPPGWMAAAVVLDVLLVTLVVRVTRGRDGGAPSADAAAARTTFVLSAVAFAVFVLPMFLQRQGGIAGRHLALPSLAVAAVAALALDRRRPRALAAVVAMGLVVAQGSAWAQVGACRINRALFEALRAKAPELVRGERVVVDLASFTEAIPSTWIDLPFDRLNTYYGAQAFEEWGTQSMVTIVAGDRPVLFAVEHPVASADGRWLFPEGQGLGSRSHFSVRPQAVPRAGTVLVGFHDAFPSGFGGWGSGGLRVGDGRGNHARDPLRGVAVAERLARIPSRPPLLEGGDAARDGLRFVADQPVGSAGERLQPFRGLAQGEAGRAQQVGLLLHAAGVGEDGAGLALKAEHRQIGLGRHEADRAARAQARGGKAAAGARVEGHHRRTGQRGQSFEETAEALGVVHVLLSMEGREVVRAGT